MTATVTDQLKFQFAKYLADEATAVDSNEYYIAIGKSDQYSLLNDNIINPVQTFQEMQNARANIQSVKKVENVSMVIDRKNWTAGQVYSAYNDTYVGMPTDSYYVITEDNEVYICLKAGAGTSTVKPSYATAGVTLDKAFDTADGYRWKYLYEVAAADASAFLTSNFIPIKLVTGAGVGAAEQNQVTAQNSAVKGQILSLIIDSGGSGYASAPTATIVGDGTGAILSSPTTLTAGVLTGIDLDSANGGGKDYRFADVKLTGGSPDKPAKVRAFIAPNNGLGSDPRIDLKANSIMFNVKTIGDENSTLQNPAPFLTDDDQDFRQISLIRNIEKSDSAGAGANDDMRFKLLNSRGLRHLRLSTTISATDFNTDDIITGTTSGIKAFIDDLDSANGDRIFIHQNDRTGFGVFTQGETISGGSETGKTLRNDTDYTNDAAIDPFSGDLLYIENRAAVTRATNQTEDIKVVITT